MKKLKKEKIYEHNCMRCGDKLEKPAQIGYREGRQGVMWSIYVTCKHCVPYDRVATSEEAKENLKPYSKLSKEEREEMQRKLSGPYRV